MDSKIIKDIRYYELKPIDYQENYDGHLGNIYHDSPDTKYIGQRIARKLNEFGFISGEFDHIYINLSPILNENEINESDVFLDKRIKYFNCGVTTTVFNNLSEFEKDNKIKDITFNVLHWIYKTDDLKTHLINNVKNLLDKFDKHLSIQYKTHETASYRIDLSFQIRPETDKSKLIIEYINKKENNTLQDILDILDYEDLYSLIDKVSSKNGFIVFQPKKNHHAELVAAKYNSFMTGINLEEMAQK